jgi:hypothetical protein
MVKQLLHKLVTAFRNSFTYDGRLRLPPKPVYLTFGAIMTLLLLSTFPQSAFDFYQVGLDRGLTPLHSVGQAFLLTALLLFALTVLGGSMLYLLSLLFSVVIPDLVSLLRAIWSGIQQIPAALVACRNGLTRAGQFVGSAPSRWRSMSADDKNFAKFMTVFFAVALAIGYVLWPFAHAAHSSLPHWMQSDEWWMGTLFIDTMMSVLSIAFIAPFVTGLLRLALKRRRN